MNIFLGQNISKSKTFDEVNRHLVQRNMLQEDTYQLLSESVLVRLCYLHIRLKVRIHPVELQF